VLYGDVGLVVGDIAAGVLSQLLGSRRKAVLVFVALCAVGMAGYFVVGKSSLTAFHVMCFVLGITHGYWAVFVTMASEQFGTNLRATTTTTTPNFVRGAVVPLTQGFKALIPGQGAEKAAIIVGAITLVLALLALLPLGETFGKDLDYVED
jgi:putative MFS transporter